MPKFDSEQNVIEKDGYKIIPYLKYDSNMAVNSSQSHANQRISRLIDCWSNFHCLFGIKQILHCKNIYEFNSALSLKKIRNHVFLFSNIAESCCYS